MSAMRDRLKSANKTLSVLPLVLSLAAGCITEPDSVDNDATNTIVQIISMQGQSGGPGGAAEAATDLFSDVCIGDPPGCSVFNDNAIVTMRAFAKDRTQLEDFINDIIFERYRVTFIRTDGRNVAGVDIPYPFDGVANFRVPIDGGDVERGFIVVRHQAKLEPPLIQLKQVTSDAGGGGGLILSAIAQIDFYGHDSAGRSITVTGYLNVVFANFGDG